MDEMCISFGANTNDTRRRADSAAWLQAGPIGLGYLAVTGYAGDLRTYYCPSWDVTSTRMKETSGQLGFYRGGSPYTDYSQFSFGMGMAVMPRAVQMLGGFTPKFLTNGNYYQVGSSQLAGQNAREGYYLKRRIGSTDYGAVGAMSSYVYRSQAVMAGGDYDTGAMVDGTRFPAHYTRPLVITELGCPLFKTQRLLGNRSVVADTFQRSHREALDLRSGLGIYHHREGFNVLYGDGHTAWYGDPQQRISWTNLGPRTDGTLLSPWVSPGNWAAPLCGGSLAGTTVDRTLSGANGYVSGRSEVYHLFDVAAGADVGSRPLP
jgi:prepilin-type processing-associated H-X9-DG protein